ncbi:dynein regulatory complex subunit 4-like [Betta splendens]|uniref:Dynein regulatory complex subunit 4 n=1 Tax=Betta splendens TaxID=158456 RepID=A0A6P7MTA2_BETSP|nr:dynein regulatory complex subunit 4-like [Betta splendens]
MPPKTKGKKSGKAKSSSVVDGVSTEEMSKDQLEEHIVRLREELDREREERSYFQLERDKIMAFWEICKRDLEETKAELRNRLRERDEAEDRHRAEISVYKHKLKHVLSEQHNTVSELKMDSVAVSSLVQNQHTESELRLREDTQGLQADLREKQLQNQNCIKELKLKHQVELMELTNEYDRRIREMEVKYHRRMKVMVEEDRKKQQEEVSELENRMRSHVVQLLKEQDRALRGAEEYYSQTQRKLMEEQLRLKRELAEEQDNYAQTDRKLKAAQRENQRLHGSLQDLERKLPLLHNQLQDYNQAKAQIAEGRARLKVSAKELRGLMVEHELLLQAFQKVEQERDELLRRQTEAVLDVQQRSGLKELLLQRKLAALTETLEQKEAQLCAALSASNPDPAAGGSSADRLQEIVESKDAAVRTLQDDLARECQDYNDLLQSCQDRLKTQGVPLFQFPFRPAEQILNGGS